MKVLVIEDEKLVAESIRAILEHKGFEVETVYDGEAGKEYAELGIYDLLILDVMMPKLDGFQVARQVRADRCNTPILMLTARSDIEDRIQGLNAGADYYLTKPFDSRELLACVNALLRRQGDQVDELRMGNTALDLANCTLVCGDSSVRLSAREFDVMRFLLQNKGRVLSKEMILSKVWGYDSNAVENHVEVYVGFLRKMLNSIGSNLKIVAIRRLGADIGGGHRAAGAGTVGEDDGLAQQVLSGCADGAGGDVAHAAGRPHDGRLDILGGIGGGGAAAAGSTAAGGAAGRAAAGQAGGKETAADSRGEKTLQIHECSPFLYGT